MRTATAAVVITGFLAGCGGQAGQPSATAERPPATAADPAAAPSLSRGEYQRLLTSAARRVRASLDGVRRALTVSGLESRLSSAEEELDAIAVAIEEEIPPAEVETEHERLVLALYDLAEAAGDAYYAVGIDFFGAPSVMARISRGEAAAELRSVARELAAAGYRVRGLALARRRTPQRRLGNGAVLRSPGGGAGTFTADNGTEKDAVVKLVGDNNRAVAIFYVRHGASATVGGIPNGRYRIRFAQGDDWDAKRNTFTRNREFTQFDERANFTGAVAITVTLHGVFGGNASTSDIDGSEF
jgi:hypothetical protein